MNSEPEKVTANSVRSASEGETVNPEWELIGRRLVSIRANRLQPEMAKLLGVSKSTLGRLERGVREVGVDVLKRLAVMGWSPLWVLTGEGDQQLPSAVDPSHAVDTALIVGRADASEEVRAAELRRTQGMKDFAAGARSVSQSMRLDKAKLSEALAAVESAIGALGYEVSAEGRARVTALLYERMVEASLTPAQLVAYVLNTIKESVNAGER